MEPSLPTSFYCINYSIWILVYFFSINHIKGRCWVFSKYLYSSIEDYFRNITCRSARCSLFVLFEKSHGNGGTKVRYLEGGPFGPVLGKHFFCGDSFTAPLARQVTSPQLTSIQKLLKLKWHAWFKLCAVMFLVLEVRNLCTIFFFFLLGDYPNLIFWRSILLAPNLHLHRRFWN